LLCANIGASVAGATRDQANALKAAGDGDGARTLVLNKLVPGQRDLKPRRLVAKGCTETYNATCF